MNWEKMADTLGSLVDKLNTVDFKLWNNQELLYEIRHMTFEEFKQKYFNEEKIEILWNFLQKASDLNLQRNQLIDEIDEKVIKMINGAISGKNLDNGGYIQRKHKTY